ncbi:MAG: magnesium/cobalt transporter CorA [Deltaproteobacteria bacterium]|jgi:magnesium transporter
MPQTIKSFARKAGLPPGSLVPVAEKEHAPPCITVIRYTDTGCVEHDFDGFTECLPLDQEPGVTWINITGVSQVKTLEKLGECFQIHPLVLEDILDVEQRPKIEDYDTYLHIALKTIGPFREDQEVEVNQVNIILGPGYVISFHEGGGDVFRPVRERLLAGKGRIRKLGADYLAYALIDLVVDNYFVALESFSDKVEFLEDEVVIRPTPETLLEVHRFKNDMVMLRKSLWPLREVIARLERRESPLISENLTMYFKDVYDHSIIAIESVETYRDILSGMLDIYLSSMSNRLNEVMKVLTIIATIFMPLTFITGFFGMNFKHMAELEWQYGQSFTVLAMVVIAAAMLWYFRKKQWI